MTHTTHKAGVFQSTLPVWGATYRLNHSPRISMYFNPHSPCGERRNRGDGHPYRYQFQSTLPVWGATDTHVCMPRCLAFQSTLPVWGATWLWSRGTRSRMEFQSTLPVWGATKRFAVLARNHDISIHTPRVGSDGCCHNPLGTGRKYFNPHSPCGERPDSFQMLDSAIKISIHTPRVGSDLLLMLLILVLGSFQSTLPVWGATILLHPPKMRIVISIHTPRVGSDVYNLHHKSIQDISIHTPRVGSDGGQWRTSFM